MEIRNESPVNQAVNGQLVVTSTTAQTGTFGGMLVVADAVVSAMEWSPEYVTGTLDWSDLGTIPAGMYIPGRFRSLTLTSGKVILIRE